MQTMIYNFKIYHYNKYVVFTVRAPTAHEAYEHLLNVLKEHNIKYDLIILE